MKKTISVFLAIAVCLFLFVGCNREEKSLTLSYQLEQRTASPGETICITVEMKNVGKAFTFATAPVYTANLRIETDGQVYVLQNRTESATGDGDYIITMSGNDKVVIPEGVTFAKGDILSVLVYFDIPADAPAGSYSLAVDYEWASQTFPDVITID